MIEKTVYFISLGCPKNLVDSEVMLGTLKANGYEITDDPISASVIVINTCGFIHEAKEESVNTILEYARLKKKNLKKLIVAGCMVQRYKSDFVKLLPEVDIFIGTNDYPKIFDYIKEHNRGSAPSQVSNAPSKVSSAPSQVSNAPSQLSSAPFLSKPVFHAGRPTYIHTSKTPRILSSGKKSAYLKIAEGCKNHCSYCIIPKLRGNFRSRREDDIIAEAKYLAKRGVIELNLIAQDIGAYGSDLSDGANLASLLKKLCKVKGIEWLRLLYLHPNNITDEVLDIIKDEEKIVKYIDLPIQHISTRILKLMNRHQTEKEVKKVISKIKNKLPRAALRTSLIVGFPTETKDDFKMLCDFISDVKFDNLGVFEYSKEEGTKAYDMEGHIHHSTKKSRYNKILKIQADISRENNLKYLGKTLPVIVEGVSEESEFIIKGRTKFQAPDIDGCVYITGGEYKIGAIQKVEIYETHTYDLVGRVV